MRLSTMIIIVFVFATVFGSVGGTYYFYLQSTEILENAVISHLETTANSKAHNIETALKMYEQRARLVTSKTWMRKHLKSYLETSDEEYKINVEQILTDTQKENSNFLHISITNPEGKIIISTEESLVDRDISGKDIFINGKENYFVSDFFEEDVFGVRIVISGPLIQDGEFLGVVAVGSDGKTVEKIMTSYGGLGETGEIYLINKDGYMVTPSRFEEDTFLKQKIDTENTKHCFQYSGTEAEEDTHLFNNYKGISVLGTHIYIPKMDWCLLAEINETEAFGDAREELIRTSLGIIIVITAIMSLIGFFVAKFISKPIKKLTKTVDLITKGKLDVQLKKSRIDEIQSLTDSLDRILASLKLAILRTGLSKGEVGLGKVITAKEEAENKFQTLYESSRDAIMILEPPTWNFTAGNPATLKMFGAKTEKEFISKNPSELSPPTQPNGKPSAEGAKKEIGIAIEKGSNFFEWTHRKIDGTDFKATVLLTKMKIRGKDFLQATVRNITEEKDATEKLEASRKRFKLLSEVVFEGILIHDKGKIIDVNNQFAKIFGYSSKELIGTNAINLIAPEQKGNVREKISSQYEKAYKTIGLRKDGSKFKIEINAKKTKIEGKIVRVAVCRDLSVKKKNDR